MLFCLFIEFVFLQALDERKEKLHQTELKTEEMADAAQAYLDSATQLAKKFAK